MPFVQNFEGKFKVRQVWPMIIGELKRRHRQPSSDRVNNANGKSHSNVRGAPRVTDPKRDGMIDASVKDSHSRAAVARMYGIDIDEVKRAQDRNRKRNK
jgi:hypothetical protein